MQSTTVWRVLVPVVLLLIGLLLATSARLAAGTDLRAERRTDLVDLIRAEQDRVEAETTSVSDLQDQLKTSAGAAAPVAIDPELEALISEVEGPGLSVTLEDAPIPADGVPDGYTAEDYIVHEQDVQAVINALWAGGAEAIGVMDQRIIATSAVRCVGSTLLLHGQVVCAALYRYRRGAIRSHAARARRFSPGGDLPPVRRPPRARLRRQRVRLGIGARIRGTVGRAVRSGGGVSAARRTVGVVGELLITAGVVVLLFVAYQLVWTNVQADRAATAQSDNLERNWGERNTGDPEFDLPLKKGEAFALLRIPRLGDDYRVPIVEGVSLDDLAQGVGHYPETALPGRDRQLLGCWAPSDQRGAIRVPRSGRTSATMSSLSPEPPGTRTRSPRSTSSNRLRWTSSFRYRTSRARSRVAG